MPFLSHPTNHCPTTNAPQIYTRDPAAACPRAEQVITNMQKGPTILVTEVNTLK
jgi:hypothetical protein